MQSKVRSAPLTRGLPFFGNFVEETGTAMLRCTSIASQRKKALRQPTIMLELAIKACRSMA